MPHQNDTRSVKLQAVPVILLVVGTLIGAVVLGILTSTRFNEIENSWNRFSSEREIKVQLLANITTSLGYGGFIHHFKNWVLRGTQDRAGATAASLKLLRNDISKYRNFQLTAEEETALESLLHTINTYADRFHIVADLHSRHAPVSEIDTAVRIDDNVALLALATLRQAAATAFLEAQQEMLASVAKGNELVVIGFILLPVPILAAIAAIFFVRRLLREIRRRSHAEMVAENASKSKSEFLASMSHELRTPMNAVLGFAQMLQFDPRTSLSSSQNGHVESIITGGNHLLELINDILDLSKIEADQTAFNVEDVNAFEVMADCIVLTTPLGEQRGITIHNHFTENDDISLYTDSVRFKQVLLNLLSNAVKYNKDGGVVILDGHETERGFLRLNVTDTGIGIPASDHHKVFQMFHRVGADPMIVREGTGIGLTVTKLLVEKLAGRIGFESEEGVGSTFWVELPMASNDEAVIWSEDLRVGVDAIDNDHQIIFAMTNKVVQGDMNNTDFDDIIGELINYTRYHFRREEAIMAICGYPELEEHRKRHHSLIAQVKHLSRTWQQKRDIGSIRKFRTFLRVWWIGHITEVDTTIAQHTHGREEKIRNALATIR